MPLEAVIPNHVARIMAHLGLIHIGWIGLCRCGLSAQGAEIPSENPPDFEQVVQELSGERMPIKQGRRR